MKRRVSLKKMATYIAGIALCLGISQTANSQGFKVKIPASSRFVKVKAEGVNVRRLPNATSGKVMAWYSDGGSMDTYSKIFYSDTEAKLYRASNATGAYTDVYHPNKGDWMIVPSTQQEPVNGWFNVIATAQEYDGNPGKGNAKLGWIKGDFCETIDIVNDASNAQKGFPVWMKYDYEKGKYNYGRNVSPLEGGSKRGFGKYANMRLFIIRDEENSQLHIASAIVADNKYLLVARLYMEVMQDEELTSDFSLELMDTEMGDAPVIKMKSNQNMLQNAAANLLKCPDSMFKLLTDAMFPDGAFPTDEVYVTTTTGKRECINFQHNGFDNEFEAYTLSYE